MRDKAGQQQSSIENHRSHLENLKANEDEDVDEETYVVDSEEEYRNDDFLKDNLIGCTDSTSKTVVLKQL